MGVFKLVTGAWLAGSTVWLVSYNQPVCPPRHTARRRVCSAAECAKPNTLPKKKMAWRYPEERHSAASSDGHKDNEIFVDRDGIPHYTGHKIELLKEYESRVNIMYESIDGEDAEAVLKKKKMLGVRLLNGLHKKAWRQIEPLTKQLDSLKVDGGHKIVVNKLKGLGAEGIKKKKEAFEKFFKRTYRSRGKEMDDYLKTFEENWADLQQLDALNINMSDDLLAYFLLEHSGINNEQKLLVELTSTNEYDLAEFRKVLKQSFSEIHHKEKGPRPAVRGQYYRKGYANAADGEDAAYGDDDSIHSYDSEDGYEYADEGQAEDDEEFEVPSDVGAEENPDVQEAYSAYDESRKKLRDVQKKRGIFTATGELTFEERKKAIEKEKEKSRCAKCGEFGHWAGDAACKHSGGSAKWTSKTPAKKMKGGSKGGRRRGTKGKGKGKRSGGAYHVAVEDGVDVKQDNITTAISKAQALYFVLDDTEWGSGEDGEANMVDDETPDECPPLTEDGYEDWDVVTPEDEKKFDWPQPKHVTFGTSGSHAAAGVSGSCGSQCKPCNLTSLRDAMEGQMLSASGSTDFNIAACAADEPKGKGKYRTRCRECNREHWSYEPYGPVLWGHTHQVQPQSGDKEGADPLKPPTPPACTRCGRTSCSCSSLPNISSVETWKMGLSGQWIAGNWIPQPKVLGGEHVENVDAPRKKTVVKKEPRDEPAARGHTNKPPTPKGKSKGAVAHVNSGTHGSHAAVGTGVPSNSGSASATPTGTDSEATSEGKRPPTCGCCGMEGYTKRGCSCTGGKSHDCIKRGSVKPTCGCCGAYGFMRTGCSCAGGKSHVCQKETRATAGIPERQDFPKSSKQPTDKRLESQYPPLKEAAKIRCPAGDGNMVARQNTHNGSWFFGCEMWPQCRKSISYPRGMEILRNLVPEPGAAGPSGSSSGL